MFQKSASCSHLYEHSISPGGLPRVGTDSESDALPEARGAVVWEGSGGHDDASRAFLESRRNLMFHGKWQVEVRKQRQLVIKRRKATV